MSNSSILVIKNVKATVPELAIIADMRADFIEIVRLCNVTDSIALTELLPSDLDNKGLVPVAYNLIVEALKNPELLNKLKANASLFGYWFFNVFIIPPALDNHSFVENNPAMGVIKQLTRGIEQLDLDN